MTLRISPIACVLTFALFLLPTRALGEEQSDATAKEAADEETSKKAAEIEVLEEVAKNATLFDFSYVSPSTPVLPLVGVEGDQITRIGALRPFGIAVLPGLGGSDQGTAVALDLAPFWALGGANTNLEAYRNMSSIDRIFARSKASVAVAWGDRATGRPTSFVISYGSRLLDGTDGLAETGLAECLKERNYVLALQIEQDQLVADLQKIPDFANMNAKEVSAAIAVMKIKRNEQVDTIYSQCVTEQARRLERAAGLDAGIGIRFNGLPGSLGGLEETGAIFWSTWTSGVFGGKAQEKGSGQHAGPISGLRARAAVSFRYTLKEAVFSDTFVLQGKRDSLALVGGIESAPPRDASAKDNFRWSLQAGWNRQNAVLPTEEDRDYWRYQALTQVRLGGGVWLVATVGRVTGKGVESDTQATLGFTFTPPTRAARIAEAYADR